MSDHRSIWSAIVWWFAERTDRWDEIDIQLRDAEARCENHRGVLLRMYANLSRDVEAQQRANRIKKRKLVGLRYQRRSDRCQLQCLNSLNGVHCAFIQQLEERHPELAAEIDAHQDERLAALDRRRRISPATDRTDPPFSP